VGIALPELAARLGDLDAAMPTIVYCGSGVRSSVAASYLRANGFDDVTDLSGGFGAWVGHDLPVAAPAPSSA
jgi:rhodanese-related sulfurtransferase